VSGKSGRQIAGELGINEQSLKVWKQQFKQGPASGVAPTLDALQAENRRLQRELRRAQEQRDLLKKCWVSSPHRARAVGEDRGHAGRAFPHRPVRRARRVAQRLPRLGRRRAPRPTP
jgi:transposase-like protein